jgi:hypothetical protein
LTLPGTVIRLLTPTQDLVFAQAIRVTRSGGGFRDLTVVEKKTAGTGQAREAPLSLMRAVGIPCNPLHKA